MVPIKGIDEALIPVRHEKFRYTKSTRSLCKSKYH